MNAVLPHRNRPFHTGYGTTSLADLEHGIPFKHGHLRQVQRIGDYAVVEYFPANPAGSPQAGETDWNALRYHGYVCGTDTGESWGSIDAALAGCIARRHQGPQHYADTIFMHLINNPEAGHL